MVDRLAEIRSLFAPAPGTIYLDAATYGLPPRPTVDALHAATDTWQRGTADWVSAWDRRGEECRSAFGALIGVDPQNVALVPSASTGVGTVATTLRADDEVLIPDDEFTSVSYPLLVAARDRGAHVRQVPLEALADSIRPSTSLVAFSLIQSQSGRGADLYAITDAARAHGARTLVDATHAVPFVPIDRPVDYLVCSAYKHLLCPRGVAFLMVDQARGEEVSPILANWRSTPDPYGSYYGPDLSLAPAAARFDVSLAWFSWAAAAESLNLLAEWKRQGLLKEVNNLAQRLAALLDLAPPAGTLVTLSTPDPEDVRTALAREGIKAAVRAGGVRLSPHIYNSETEIGRVAAVLNRHVRKLVRT
ncbi:MAG: aminotransferase class V-fold PLP-dependent enzyme [Chloroflexota bacterium]